MKATEKQIRYVKYLLNKNGYSSTWIDSSFKDFGLTMRERRGHTDDISYDVACKIINCLKDK